MNEETNPWWLGLVGLLVVAIVVAAILVPEDARETVLTALITLLGAQWGPRRKRNAEMRAPKTTIPPPTPRQ